MTKASFHTAILLLGSNMGNRIYYLKKAVNEINSKCGQITDFSKIYETASWGTEELPPHINLAVKLITSYTPTELLKKLQLIENSLERQRSQRWGERTIDIDILYFNELVIASEHLTIPHPLIQARRFALVPICDIAAGQIHPVLNKSNKELLNECTDNLSVNFHQDSL